MPVIQVKALPQPRVNESELLKRLCMDVAQLMDLKPSRVWGTWQTIAEEMYVEGGEGTKIQPKNTHPPIVSVTAFEGCPDDLIKQVLEEIARGLAQGLELDDGNVFITYHDAESGKVYTGGQVRYA